MNKADLVRAIASETDMTFRDTEAVLKAFTETVMNAVADGEKVSLVGFGSFHSITRKARTGRNPATGKQIDIPEKSVPKFTPGKEFRDKL